MRESVSTASTADCWVNHAQFFTSSISAEIRRGKVTLRLYGAGL
jgi:hypothetical protein